MNAQPHQLAAVPQAFRHLIDDHGKSPWHPSAKATKRVLNPLPAPTVHEACGTAVEIKHHTQIYGREYGEWPWMYRCATCDAMVGMHPFTSIPLGTLADRALRAARNAAKKPFEQLWQDQWMTRSEAYAELAAHLGIDVEACHFGWFDAAQCERAGNWARAALEGRA